jgi:hypothetical protein
LSDDRRARILLALAADVDTVPAGLCHVSAHLLAVSGASVTVLGELRGGPLAVCASDGVAQAVEDLQCTIGEGPSVDAYASDAPVLEGDLAGSGTRRWPAFAPAARAAGAAAVFGFPLRTGAAPSFGTLGLYRDRPGDLDDEQLADAAAVADVVAAELLVLQADRGDALLLGVANGAGLRLVVHQATGMVAAQLEVSIDEALVRLRARAWVEGVSLAALAGAVVARQVRFETDAPPDAPGTGR